MVFLFNWESKMRQHTKRLLTKQTTLNVSQIVQKANKINSCYVNLYTSNSKFFYQKSWVQIPHGSWPWFFIWHKNWLVLGIRLESDLNKLWELLHNRAETNKFKLKLHVLV